MTEGDPFVFIYVAAGVKRVIEKGEMEWFHRLYEGRELFSDRQEELAYRENQRTLTRQEVRSLAALLGLAKGSLLLDACCGNGRHSIGLAGLGYRVFGFDISRSRILFASKWARDEGATAAFFVCDLRSVSVRGGFDSVLILGGTFSHLMDEKEEIALLRQLMRLLKKDGVLLIDNPNPVRFWSIRNGGRLPKNEDEVKFFDLPLGGGPKAGFVRYYGRPQMKRLLNIAGFKRVTFLGDRSGRPFTLKSPRMVVLAAP